MPRYLLPSLLALTPVLCLAAETRPVRSDPLAAVLTPMAPTPSGQPAVLPPQHTDGLGASFVRPYRPSSRAESLYHQIGGFVSDLEQRVMSEQLALPSASPQRQTKTSKSAAKVPLLMKDETQIDGFLLRLAELDRSMPYPNQVEGWHLDESWHNLERAANMLRLGLSAKLMAKIQQLRIDLDTQMDGPEVQRSESMIPDKALIHEGRPVALIDDSFLSPDTPQIEADEPEIKLPSLMESEPVYESAPTQIEAVELEIELPVLLEPEPELVPEAAPAPLDDEDFLPDL